MAKTVFYSFHYGHDAWRVQKVLQIGAVEGQRLLNSQDWEAVRRRGQKAIQEWIDKQMSYKSTVVVLIGAHTAERPWVEYEITKAWNDKRGLLGVRIHGLADSIGGRDRAGKNPFADVALRGGGTVADHVPVFSPAGSTSAEVYSSIRDNLTRWVDQAYRRA